MLMNGVRYNSDILISPARFVSRRVGRVASQAGRNEG